MCDEDQIAVMAVVDEDSAVMVAWKAYKARPDYNSTRRWAQVEAHVDGSLWAAFLAGYLAGSGETVGDLARHGGNPGRFPGES